MKIPGMKSTLLALVLLSPAVCGAADASDLKKAVDVILTACVGSASTGAPVDMTGLSRYFRPKAKDDEFSSQEPLPPLLLLLNNKGTFRCVLMGKMAVAESDFARALKEGVESWPRLKHSPTGGLDTAYLDQGDAQQGIHKVLVTIEITNTKVWSVMVWDAGLPK